MWDCTDSQEVGLEAATLERVRNSSLVECAGAENSTGLKPHTEAADLSENSSGRGAFCTAEKPDWKDGWSVQKCECRYE